MARLTVDRYAPMSPPLADPARQEVSFTVAVHLTVSLRRDEARQWHDEFGAALGRLNVAHAEPVVTTA